MKPKCRTLLVDDADRLRKAWEYIREGSEPIGFDVETSGPTIKWGKQKGRPDAFRHTITGFSLSRGATAIYVPLRHKSGPNIPVLLGKAVIAELIELAERGRIVWVHNLGYELNILINEGLYQEHRELPPGFRCSQVAVWLARTWRGKDAALKKAAGKIFGFKDLKDWMGLANGRQADEMTPAEIYEYAALDAWLTVAVGQNSVERHDEYELTNHYFEMDLPLVEITRGMARAGMDRDVERLKALREVWAERRDRAAAEFTRITTTEVEIPLTQDVPTGEFYKTGKRAGQPKTKKQKVLTKVVKGADVGNDIEVSRWCYEILNWWPVPTAWDRRKSSYEPIEKNDRGVYSVKKAYVSKFFGLAGDAGYAAKLRLEYQRYEKLIGTYLNVLIELPDQYGDGLIHPSLNVTGTQTQRFSGSGPNFQNIPARPGKDALTGMMVHVGKEIRECLRSPFVTEDGRRWPLIVRDYSQIELRLQADIANDTVWLEGYRIEAEFGIKFDLHQQAADELSKLLSQEVSRAVGKVVNLSVQYGVSPETLVIHIDTKGIDRDMCVKIIDAFYVLHARIAKYQRYCEKFATKHGYIPTKDGFKRFGFVAKYNKAQRKLTLTGHDKRAASNTPVQGWSGGIMKASMVDMWRKWVAEGIYGGPATGGKVCLINSVHDEIVATAHPEYADRIGRDMDTIMVRPRWGIKVPITVEGGKGDTWANAK